MNASPSLPAPALSTDTSRCEQWARAGERACYGLGTIYAPQDADAFVLAHEAAHHVQMLQGRAVMPLSDSQRRVLEAEAVRVQLQCGRV